METYFENISVNTVEQNYEAIWHFQRKGIVRNLVLMGIGIVVVVVLWCIQDTMVYLAAALLYAGMFIWQLRKPRRAAQRIYDNKLAYYDNVLPPATFLFYEDHFEVSDIDSHNTVAYKKIHTVGLLKFCTAVDLADGRVFLVSNDGFQKGTLEEFRAFLRTKSPS